MNWRDTKMRGPRPSVGWVNRDHGSGGPGAFGYGRSGTLNKGQNYYNSYMEAEEDGRSSLRMSSPVYKGNWTSFIKNCLAEAHVAGVNEALTIASKAYQYAAVWSYSKRCDGGT